MAPDFLPTFAAALAAAGIAPSRLEIELTEAVLVDNATLAADRPHTLRAASFLTALDDFGTGYSSVGYLERLRFDRPKLDHSVVRHIHGPPDGTEVVRGLIIMAHGFGMKVTCEGVETEEDLQLLRDLGCDLFQGYLFDAPLPIDRLATRWMPPASPTAAVA